MSLPNAFITLLTSSSYLPGCLVLLHSLLDLHPEPRDFKTVCLVTPETVDARSIGELRKAGWDLVIGVEGISSGPLGVDGLSLMGRPDLNLALTKLHLFRLSSLFSTLIYLDADVLPLRPLSHLFTTTSPHIISACPDTGWPDCFNSGVMVVRPRESDWEGLKGLLDQAIEDDSVAELAESGGGGKGNGSFDGADQGLLNEWFSSEGGGGDWNRLSFTYNVTPTAAYTYAPAYKRYGHKINAVHFIGSNKPWTNLQNRPAGVSNPVGKEISYDYPSLIDRWFAVYDKRIRPTAAHHPDIAQRFAVPETIAVWNQPNASSIPDQPTDRLSLSALKAASAFGVTSMRPGQYVSLPLDGRVDLVMPKTRSRSPLQSSTAQSPTTDSAPPLESAPAPQSLEQQMAQPATWDASRYAPPQTGRPEMEVPMNTYYKSAWDAPPESQSSYYSNNKDSDDYPTIPPEVSGNDWYKQFVHTVPDRNYSHAVFPWEEAQNRATPGRVFPRGSTPPGQHGLQAPHIQIKPSTPEHEPSPPSANQPKSMAESMASYTNAWDSVPSIQRYVSRLSGMGVTQNQPLVTPISSPGISGIPSSSNMSFISGIDKSPSSALDTRSEGSRDGDDEEGSTSSEEDSSSQSMGRVTDAELGTGIPDDDESGRPRTQPKTKSSKFKDRNVQSNESNIQDVKSQSGLGVGMSPGNRSVELPMTTSRRPSHTQMERYNQRSSKDKAQSSVSGVSGNIGSGGPRPRSDRISSSDTITSSSNRLKTPSDSKESSTNTTPTTASSTISSKSFNLQSTQPTTAPSTGQIGERIWDPRTSLDVRKRDTQEVLSRFMQAAGAGGGTSSMGAGLGGGSLGAPGAEAGKKGKK